MNQSQPSYTVYTDGGSRGNPGPAAYGYVIYSPTNEVVIERGHYIGVATNNQAEYQGIVAALEALQSLKIDHPIVCKLDSQLIVRQVNGQYRMKSPDLKPWLDKVRTHVAALGVPVTFMDVPRDQNKEADRLVNLALDSVET